MNQKLFDQVQVLLSERGEDYSKRASATSDYLLSGLIVCARCGKRFVGTSATGNRYRYCYYTCFSRQRYGVATCDAECLPAEEMDTAVIDVLRRTYQRSDLIETAVHGATPARIALLQALIHEVRVEDRDHVIPRFRVRSSEPQKVRALDGWEPPAGVEPAT